METIIKEIPIPKEVIELQEALPTTRTRTTRYWCRTNGLGIAALVVILVAAFAKYKCKCKK